MLYPTPTEIDKVRKGLVSEYRDGHTWGAYAFLKAWDSARIAPHTSYSLVALGPTKAKRLARKFTKEGHISADDVGDFLRANITIQEFTVY